MTIRRGAEPLEELRIRFRPVGADRYLVLANGPASAATVIDWRPEVNFTEQLDELFAEALRPRVPIGGAAPIETRLMELGRALFGALLPAPIRDCLEASINIAQVEGCKLRVRFDLPAALSDLPVEILSPPSGDRIGGALALNRGLSIVRSVSYRNPRLPAPGDNKQPLSILAVVASPRGRDPLDVSHELDRLEYELERFTGIGGVTLDVLGGPNNECRATLAELSDRVTRPGNPLAVLLIAHGERSPDRGQACVVLESEDGSAQPIDAGRLAGALGGRSSQVRFVALNLCVGAKVVGREPLSGVAQAIISNGIPAVVGMSTEVTDEAGSRFSAPLFKALSSNQTVDDAVQEARIQMDNHTADTRIEWCAPVLCIADGCLRGRLFKVTSLDVKVASLDGAIDPMREGLEARERLAGRGGRSFDDLAPAAFYSRAIGDWKAVRRQAKSGIDSANNQQDRERFARLEREANTELVITDIDALCLSLASDPPSGQLVLPALRGVPKPIVDHLKAEVELAKGHRRLHERYEQGLEAEQKKDWATAVKQFEIFRERDYRDGRTRICHAEGRLAEDEGRWADARDSYAAVRDGPPDVGQRMAYAQGRAAELDDDWLQAVAAYAALPAGHRDLDQRLPYAQGCSAEQAGDWPGAVTAFGSLAGYRDVTLRRGHAHAQVAAGKGDWTTVIEALTGLAGDFPGGDLGRLRSYAEARLAEDSDHWDRAAEIYRSDGERDVATRRPYAVGRGAQARSDWATAAVAYQQVPADHRDVASRLAYVTARHAERTGRWEVAVQAYQAIPEHPHTAGRLPHAQACLAACGRDWRAVIDALAGHTQLADDLRDEGKHLDCYAHGRVAEEAGQWLTANQTYRECGEFRDAPARAQYVMGRDLQDRADWTEALAAYESVADDLDDARHAVSRLKTLRDALPWVDGLPRCGFAEDPATPAELTSTYQALRASGITPSSTAAEVTEASFALMANGPWNPGVRTAWDRLRSKPERLTADALLYPLADGPALRRAQRDLEAGPAEELLTQLQNQLGPDAPLFALLSGQREAAIAAWEGRLRDDLSASSVAHTLALASTWRAIELGHAAQHEDAARAWERAIAYWGRISSDDAYWSSWRNQRATCYQVNVSAADLAQARRALVDRLSGWLAEAADRSRLDGRAEDVQRYKRLRLALEVEVAGARALASAGGLVGSEPATPAFGPLLVRLHPELRVPVGRLVAQLDAEEGAEPGAGSRLRCAFSELAGAAVLLEQNRPDQALEALHGQHRVMLIDLPADCGHVVGFHATGCAECAEFSESNPGHAGLRHRRTRLLQDAVDVATRALLALAHTALVEGRTGVDTALRRWREAIEVATNIGGSVRVKQAIVPVVLGRADVLKEEHWGTRLADERLTEAIGLAAAAQELVGNLDAGQLSAKEAELLTIRGIWRGCWCYEHEDPSYQRGVDDLRQALTLNPDSLDTRDNLAQGLMNWAQSLHHSSQAPLQLRLLGEALAVVHDGLLRTPGYVVFGGVLGGVLDELEQWCYAELSDDELNRRLREPPAAPGADHAATAEGLVRKAEGELAKYPVAGVLTQISAVRLKASAEIRERLIQAITQLPGWEQ